MATTSMDQVERAVPEAVRPVPKAVRPEVVDPARALRTDLVRVYCSGGSKPYAELHLTSAAMHHLGDPLTVSVSDDSAGGWRLTADGPLTVRPNYASPGTPTYEISVKRLARALPATGRTALPVELVDGVIVLHPELVAAVAPKVLGRHPQARQESTAPAQVPLEGLTPEGAKLVRKLTEGRFVAGAPDYSPAGERLTPAVVGASPLKKAAASLDDLRAALEMLRGVVIELGVTLHAADGSAIELGSVQVRVTI